MSLRLLHHMESSPLTHLVLHFLGGLVADDVGIGGGVHCALFYSGDIDSEAEVRDTKDRITIVHGRRAERRPNSKCEADNVSLYVYDTYVERRQDRRRESSNQSGNRIRDEGTTACRHKF